MHSSPMTFPHILSIEPLKLTVGDKIQEGFVVKELETETYFLKINVVSGELWASRNGLIFFLLSGRLHRLAFLPWNLTLVFYSSMWRVFCAGALLTVHVKI